MTPIGRGMLRRSKVPLLAAFGMAVVAGVARAQDVGAADASGEIGRLTAVWKEQRSKVVTLRVRGYKFAGGAIDPANGRALGEAEVGGIIEKLRALLADRNAPASIEPLKALTAPLFAEKAADGRKGLLGTWRPYSMIEESGTVRVEDGWTTTVRGPGGEVGYSPGNTQVDIHPVRTGLVVETVSTFLYQPDLARPAIGRTLVKPATGPARITGPRYSLEYDAGSGAVARHVILDGRGTPLYERIQGGEAPSPEGIPLPRYIVQIHYARGGPADPRKVEMLTVLVLNEVALNGAVDESAFDIAYPPGATIVQFPGGNTDGTVPKDQRPPRRVTRAEQPGVIRFPRVPHQPE